MSSAVAGMRAEFDPSDPAFLADPYPVYAKLRRESPVGYLPEAGVWVVTRYDDVCAVMRDPAVFSSKAGMAPHEGVSGILPGTGIGYRIGAPGVRVLIATDPPEHHAFRRAVAGAFSPAAVDRLAPAVERIVRAHLDPLLERDGPADFFAELAEPVPALVLAELLGVPPELRDEFGHWSATITSDLAQSRAPARSVGRGIDMFRFFSRRLQSCGQSASPLLGALAGAAKHGITTQEALAFCAFLLVAGLETTSHLLTNVLDILIRHPQVAERMRADPALIPVVVDEALRYDTSVQALWRGTTREVVLRGQRLAAGSRLLVVFGSANRDERRFPDPDSFRLDRQPNEHLGFGAGPHRCLGARLAQLEMTTVLRQLLAATRGFEPAGPAVRTSSFVLRGFTRQPIRLVRR